MGLILGLNVIDCLLSHMVQYHIECMYLNLSDCGSFLGSSVVA